MLAEMSRVGLGTIQNFETLDKNSVGKPKPNESTLFSLEMAFKEAGIEFIGNSENTGVILHRKSPKS